MRAAESAPALPLAGIRVLELGHIVAGPSAGLIVADLGADVRKVEDPRTGAALSSERMLGIDVESTLRNTETGEGHTA